MALAYRTGDIVVVRPDLYENECYEHVDAVRQMVQLAGREAVITRVDTCGRYFIDLDGGEYLWSASMFCGTKEEYETRNDWSKPFTPEMLDLLLRDLEVCVRITSEKDALELFVELQKRGYNNTDGEITIDRTNWEEYGPNTVYWLNDHEWAFDEMKYAEEDSDHLIKYTFRAVALSDIEIPDDDIGLLF